MVPTLNELRCWMAKEEDEHLEFKEAKRKYDFEKLVKYCVALANEGGGAFILGVSDRRPRKIVGTQAFQDIERTKAGLIERIRMRIEVTELRTSEGRVAIVQVPARPRGVPIQYKGAYWMRAGQRLVPMTPDMLRAVFQESDSDFSGQVCLGASLDDLDTEAIETFRAMWHRKSGSDRIKGLSQAELLAAAELLVDGGVTYAALILLGKRASLGKYLAQAEVIFEYRSSRASVPYLQREEFREGFFVFHDRLWSLINLRNDVQHYQDGLFVWDIQTFDEAVVREAILNAVAHRDYRLPGSVFLRQYPRELEIVSPGGFPPGITVDNILWRQSPRNRRIAEVFSRCGLVERSGQGVDRMFEVCISQSKPVPDYEGTDDYQVSLVLRGEIQDPRFLRFLEEVGKKRLSSFTTRDFLVLEAVHNHRQLEQGLRGHARRLAEEGVLERVGRGRGARYILSRRFYRFIGKKGAYTRAVGLDRETNKHLLLKHIRDNRKEGSTLRELMEVLPSLSRSQVQGLLRELKSEGRARVVGRTRGAKWFPSQCPEIAPGGANRQETTQ